jgi:Tol biopolymer transport system component
MLTKTARGGIGLAALTTLTALVLPAAPAGANAKLLPVTAIVSATPSGTAGNQASNGSDVSSNGRYVAFTSIASNLVAGDTNSAPDVFVRDTLTATTVRVSTAADGTQGNSTSDQPTISRDGRYVAFRSGATNLVPGDTNGFTDVFIRDLRNKTTVRASVAAGSAAQAVGGDSSNPSLSGSGLQLAFESKATNIIPGDANGAPDVFVRDQDAGTMEQVTSTSAEAPLALGGSSPSISGTGRYVAFTSTTNAVGAFSDSYEDVFLRDRALGTTERVSLSTDAALHPNGSSSAGSVSDDGRYVAFKSMAGNLVTFTDAAATMDVFVRDRSTATTDLVTRSTANVPSAKGGTEPSISADGTKVAFTSNDANLVSGDTNDFSDVFLRTLSTGATNRWSVSSTGAQLAGYSSFPAISSDGSAVSFAANAPNAFGTDTNGNIDVYVRTAFQIGPSRTARGSCSASPRTSPARASPRPPCPRPTRRSCSARRPRRR